MSEITYKTVLEALLPPGSLWRPAKTFQEASVGVELITNGTFDTDISGWTDSSTGGSSISWDAGGGDGRMHLLNGAVPNVAAADQSFPTVNGATYRVTFEVEAGSGLFGRVLIGTSQGGEDLLAVQITSITTYEAEFTAQGSTSWIRLEYAPPENGMYIDDVSVKALTAASVTGLGLNQLLTGIADNHTLAWDFLKTLRYIREPQLTPILEDLEREYGIYPNPALTEQERRDKLAAVKYARVGTGSKDDLEQALHRAGFTNLFVWENSPAQNPAIFFGGAEIYCQLSPPLFVATASTGTGDRAMSSPDGITWTLRSSAADNAWRSCTYGQGLWVAVSSNGIANRVMTSPDGINWTSRDTTGKDNDWFGVTYGGAAGSELFVAVASTGTGNRVMTSPDGINWTIRVSAADNSWRSVAWGNGMFVAVSTNGTGNRVMSSPDGINWTIRVSAANNDWRGVTYGNGLFVAVSSSGTGNRVMTSPDGITWTIRTSAADNDWWTVTYGMGLFVAVARSGVGNRVMTSPDGINWTLRSSAADNDWRNVTYWNYLFVAVSADGVANRVMTSPDGIAWTSRDTTGKDNAWLAVKGGITPASLAQCGEPSAQCGWFEGELIVNGDIFDFTVDYLTTCGETLAQCDEPTALSGNFSGVTRTKIEYPLPTDPLDWPLIFFVGGDATYNPDTGASIYCGDTLAQCDEPIAFCQWFCGALQKIEFVDLPYSRRADLVRLILQIKPIHSWCALLVNFT